MVGEVQTETSLSINYQTIDCRNINVSVNININNRWAYQPLSQIVKKSSSSVVLCKIEILY